MTQQSVTSTQQVATPKKGRRQQKVGRVVSNKMNKTIVVVVETLKKHRIYKRTYKQTKRFQAHDEENICQIGDLVRIEECRPLSKMKRWRLIEIIKPSRVSCPLKRCWLRPIPTCHPKSRSPTSPTSPTRRKNKEKM